MKILAVASTMDLAFKLGCTPSWWQLWKALHETGNEVVVTPYLGDPVNSLWWRTYSNPCRNESMLFNHYLTRRKANGRSPSAKTFLSPLFQRVVNRRIRPRWKRHLENVIRSEKDVDALLFMNVPISHINGIAGAISREYGVPSVFYDGDMPSVLPEYAASRGLRFSYYNGTDLSEFDMFLVNSEAVVPRLKEMGARNVHPFHYGVDPELFAPISVPKDIDVAYYALNSDAREAWMTILITRPSIQTPEMKFRVGGGLFRMDLGEAQHVGDLTFSEYRKFCCRSVVNLNITSWTHATARGTSTSRPFELAALGSCMVSQPYDGIEAWFEPGKEIIIANDELEATKVYSGMLDNRQTALEFGTKARDRVLREHTYRHRARELVHRLETLT